MIPFALPAAVAGLSKAKWIAIAVVVLLVLAVIGGLIVWAKLEQSGRISAEAKQHEAELARDFYKADATRWQAANAEQIKVNAANIAAFELERAALARSAEAAIAAAKQAEQNAETTAAQLAKLRSKANATPDDVRPIGPLVRGGLEWLRCRQQAGPGADTGACADPN